jgi:dTDP-4-dehydrorhamnose reductase
VAQLLAMRVLLIGGSGQLGSEILRNWTDCQIAAPPSTDLNLEDSAALARALDADRPELVVNCAAFHNVDICEAEPERAFAINATAVDGVARACRDRDIAFLTISTDYVFDGETDRAYGEEDVPCPISTYGVSKLAGELLVERLQMRAFVVRTCGLYATRISTSKGYTFVDRIIAKAKAGEPVSVVNDVIASPTYAPDLAKALRRLADTDRYGLYHAASQEPVSWYDFAARALRLAGVDTVVEPISAKDYKAPARRPRFSALASRKLANMGIEMRTWQQGLTDYIKDRG